MTQNERKALAIAVTILIPPTILWWLPGVGGRPSIMTRLFDLDQPDPPQNLPGKHATHEAPNKFVPGVGWCRQEKG